MTSLRDNRRTLVVVTFVALVAIVVLAPRYNDLQLATDAADFRDALPDDERGRYLAATIADFVFAAAYAATALALSTPRSRLTVIGAWLVVAGAVFDMAENAFVLAGVLDEDGITDGAVDLMRLCGGLKWAGVVLGFVLMVIGLFQHRRDRRDP